MAETKEGMQNLINRLKEYCELWNLVVNTDKSHIVVFRRGGNLAKDENWYYGDQLIRDVNEYNYLGGILSSS